MNKIFLGALAFAGVLAVPAFSYAADFAFVDQAGDVRMVTASDWQTAIRTAPNIDENSGVMLLDSTDDNDIVGDDVSGV